uniref:Uncharacterized protein n=1 Tax=Arundo donax TaxID=35708 RepID=A0A0A9GEW1_ARUDO
MGADTERQRKEHVQRRFPYYWILYSTNHSFHSHTNLVQNLVFHIMLVCL